MLNRLKIRLEITENDKDLFLEEMIESAIGIFLSLRYPTTPYPLDESQEPFIELRYHDWIMRCAVELYSKSGAEGQKMHIENSIHRSYDSGTISQALMSEIVPVAGVF